ncbi:MAG: tripartite tricarboxylate transporter TctB family protein [Burkholderiaceae bacterium]|nr:tripartite tricarboxylate transporter TctB family protein [Burkholderiaceae bacterium]
MRRVDGILSSGVLLLLGAAIAWYAPTFDLGTLETPGPGFMPFLAGLIICAAALVGIVEALRSGCAEAGSPWHDEGLGKHAFLLGLVCVQAALLERIGFLACAFLLVFASMRVVGKESWRSSALWAVLLSAGSYVVFVMWLNVDLPRGIF